MTSCKVFAGRRTVRICVCLSCWLRQLRFPVRASPLAPFPLDRCHVDGLAEEIKCGVHEVFEDRDRSGGRRTVDSRRRTAGVTPNSRSPTHCYSSPADRDRARAAWRQSPPDSFARSAVTATSSSSISEARAQSHPLTCGVATMKIASARRKRRRWSSRALRRRARRDPIHGSNHRESLADLDGIRRALGYDRINLWGGSWGTRAALLYALRYPEATRTVTLDGAVALTMGFPRTASADAQRALEVDRELRSRRELPMRHSLIHVSSSPPSNAVSMAIAITIPNPASPDTCAGHHCPDQGPGLRHRSRRLVRSTRCSAQCSDWFAPGAAGNFAPLMAQYAANGVGDDRRHDNRRDVFRALLGGSPARRTDADFRRDAEGIALRHGVRRHLAGPLRTLAER